MKFNLTESQKNLLRRLVRNIRARRIPESFEITQSSSQMSTIRLLGAAHYNDDGSIYGVDEDSVEPVTDGSQANFEALVKADCLQHVQTAIPAYHGRRTYALQALGEHAVVTNFADDPPAPETSTFTNNFHGPTSGVQIGNHNQQTVLHAVQAIQRVIEESAASPAQKAEARGVLTKFIEHPAIVSILGGLSSGVVGQMGK